MPNDRGRRGELYAVKVGVEGRERGANKAREARQRGKKARTRYDAVRIFTFGSLASMNTAREERQRERERQRAEGQHRRRRGRARAFLDDRRLGITN
jgi:hypothetical protein